MTHQEITSETETTIVPRPETLPPHGRIKVIYYNRDPEPVGGIEYAHSDRVLTEILKANAEQNERTHIAVWDCDGLRFDGERGMI